jgi:hypothetical protein
MELKVLWAWGCGPGAESRTGDDEDKIYMARWEWSE